MPVSLSRGDRRLIVAGAVLFTALVLLGAVLAPSRGAESPTTYSSASGGAKALYLLLQQSGYAVERWEQPVHELPRGAGTTLILADPIEYPNDHDRAAVARFINDGGHVI